MPVIDKDTEEFLRATESLEPEWGGWKSWQRVAQMESDFFQIARDMNSVLVSPLHDACARNDVSAIQRLITEKARELQDADTNTDPATHAAEAICTILMTTDAAGNTPLHWAAGNGAMEAMQMLLEGASSIGRSGAPASLQLEQLLSAKNRLGDTALHRAVWRQQKAAVELLLEFGIDSEVRNSQGLRAIDLVRDAEIGCLLQSYNGGGRFADAAEDGDEESDEDYGDGLLWEDAGSESEADDTSDEDEGNVEGA